MPTPTTLHQPPLRWWSHAWRLLVCLLISTVAALMSFTPAIEDGWPHPTDDQLALDMLVGLLTFVLVGLRRRWPVTVTVLVTLATAVSTFAAGPSLLAAVSLATRRRWREIVPVWVLAVAAGFFYTWWVPLPDDLPWWANLSLGAVVAGAVMAWGLYLGSRRELLWTFADRATRAEAENELRAEKARGDERTRIAREMHDVLAHRISQVSMYAGALSYREDLDAPAMREAAGLIQQQANAALADLRDVLGVLRDPGSGELLHRPQPALADVAVLVEESRGTGMGIDLLSTVADSDVPASLGRTVYRTVQEGLTNAHKHAPGSQVRVQLSGGPGPGLHVEVRNPVGFANVPAAPGAGLGLVGLSERYERADGTLEAGVRGGEYVLAGWLPWQT